MQKETWLQLVLLIYHSILSKAASVQQDRKSTRLNSSDGYISYAVFCLKKEPVGEATGAHGVADQVGATRRQALARDALAAPATGSPAIVAHVQSRRLAPAAVPPEDPQWPARFSATVTH